ncbi:MAG: ABC transporter permease, partial [Candidatus Omnitrophica bacterium]|nr:ABC transporter permease [Candidatus Omnitrophota bacterium]
MGKLIGIACILALLCIGLAIQEPKFFQERNILNLSRQIGFLGIYAMGAGIVIITGGIDLSVGSLMGLIGVVLAMSLTEWGLAV